MHELIILLAQYVVIVPVLVGVIVWFRIEKNRRLEMALLMIASAIIATLLIKLAATLHQDPRPFVRDGVHPYFSHPADNGFPSDHTTFSAVIAFVVLRYSRKLGIGLAVLSLLIGASRVVAGVHHGQDIIGGFLIAAVGVGLSLLALKFIPRPHYTRPKPEAWQITSDTL